MPQKVSKEEAMQIFFHTVSVFANWMCAWEKTFLEFSASLGSSSCVSSAMYRCCQFKSIQSLLQPVNLACDSRLLCTAELTVLGKNSIVFLLFLTEK